MSDFDDELAEADARCALIAENCRNHARVLAEVEAGELP